MYCKTLEKYNGSNNNSQVETRFKKKLVDSCICVFQVSKGDYRCGVCSH